MSNIPGSMLRPDQATEAWTLTFPIPTTALVPLFNAQSDTGKFVKGILLHREKVLGKEIYAAEDYYSIDRMIAEFKEVFPEAGKTAVAKQNSYEEFKTSLGYAGLPEKVHEEYLQNMRLMDEYGYYGGKDLKESQSILDTPLVTWKEYIQKEPKFKDLK